MVATVAGIHLGIDTHGNRPAGNTVPDGSIYSCSTHSLVYKSNYAGNSWATWASLGTAGAYAPGGTDVAIADGGTGASTKAAGFDALSPLTTSGDILYGGASGTGTRLAKGSDGQVLTLASGLPSWAAAGGGGGLTQSFTGYNTVGATWTATVANREWAKPITLAATSHFRSVDVHVRPNADSTGGGFRVGLLTDIAGVPGLLIAEGTLLGNQLFSGATSGFPGTGRWISIAIGPTVAAGNYWIVWDFSGVVLDIANDTSGGGDVRWDLGFDGFSGGHTALTQTTTAIRHSVRASILS